MMFMYVKKKTREKMLLFYYIRNKILTRSASLSVRLEGLLFTWVFIWSYVEFQASQQLIYTVELPVACTVVYNFSAEIQADHSVKC